MARRGASEAPSRLLLGLEAPRAAWEFGAFLATWPFAALGGHGDGHGVLLLPGWLTGDAATVPLRRLLGLLGYTARGWQLGRNLGITDAISDGLPRRLHALADATGGPVSLVGVSLGGVLARRLAREQPSAVRRVVTLGSPFRLYEDGDAGPLPVPATAVYSRGDGIVPWRTCRDGRPGADDVEVAGSHCGLAHNTLAVATVTERLARPPGVPSWST